ncbi:MAG: SpoIID/LytB domain-containing protein [Prevotellaceae bacterium]|jgi:SpoIID/LytB domain protein|nr:SpoIID/LytB domain-containing protein [Prevotellaceae bacterium]
MQINVGILEEKEIKFSLNDKFFCEEKNCEMQGEFYLKFVNNKIYFDGNLFSELNFENKNNSTFTLFDVKIGKNFHWQQFENQTFEGNLKIISDGENLIAINEIDIEKYLFSVISSEMRATSFSELLKAHAVISRSWLLANIKKCKMKNVECKTNAALKNSKFYTLNSTLIKWYERDAHTLFDVCADDHCQRYQGLPKNATEALKSAVSATAGEVLVYDNRICDTRFSKCCGGAGELFENCWADEKHDYLTNFFDTKKPFPKPNLRNENEAKDWILSSPDCFCNTNDRQIISQVLNDYDQSTHNFFRWKVEYSNEQLSEILHEKSGIDFGKIIDLIPLKRGVSGRIYELKIVGEKQTFTVGKELEIRRWLSKTHLYSSAFAVEHLTPDTFVLRGAGWGHGVGLCQIGAAVMSAQGFDYRQILAHYFPKAELKHADNTD